MYRLTPKTLPLLLRRPEISVILFGDPLGALMMEQAREFSECRLAWHGEAAFAYADAFECGEAAKALLIRRLPTTLIMKGGVATARLEGLQARERIAFEIEAAHAAPRALAVAIRYAITRLKRLEVYLEDGRLSIDNNAAERAIRGVALGRKNWLFAGSDKGGERAAILATLIETAKLNGVDPEGWLGDVLARIAEHPISRIEEFFPWNWRDKERGDKLAA